MALKIRLHEASPRKFRQDPSTRGVGGKYGPIGEDPLVGASKARKDSLKSWQENGTNDELFQEMFETKLKTSGLSKWYTDKYSYETGSAVDVYIKPKDIFGFDIEGNFNDNSGMRRIDFDYDAKTAIERLLKSISYTIINNPESVNVPYGIDLRFALNPELNTIQDIWVNSYHAGLEAMVAGDIDDSNDMYTRIEAVTTIINDIKKVEAYLKKMAPAIKREMERTYNK